MNIYSEIRDYVKTAIREINSSYKEHNQAHTPDNIGSFEWNNVFFVRFNTIPFSQGSGFSTLQIPITVEFGHKGGSKPIEAHDEVLCVATDLAFKLGSPLRYTGKFESVTIDSITPEPVSTNDRWTKISLSATINLSYQVR